MMPLKKVPHYANESNFISILFLLFNASKHILPLKEEHQHLQISEQEVDESDIFITLWVAIRRDYTKCDI